MLGLFLYLDHSILNEVVLKKKKKMDEGLEK